jgi:glycosyltransferase involved in cell wall biosynthesis
VFVHQRLAALAKLAELQVVSPQPRFPVLSRLRGGGAKPDDGRWEGLVVHRPGWFYLPGVLKSLDARFYARGIRQWLADFCRRWTPDVLDAHFVWPDGVGVSLLARELGVPYTITLRGWLYQAMQNRRMLPQCVEAMQRAAAIISVSGHLAQTAIGLGVDAGMIRVIPNGVDTDRFHPRDKQACRRELGLPAEGRLVVTVAHLGPRKGHREAVQAMARLPGDVCLVLVGGDPEGGKNQGLLREMVDRLGLNGRVILAGPQPYGRIPLYLSAADVSVLASYREGCPNVVLESLACGTPVVATNVGAVPDIVQPGINGEIVSVGEVEPLAEAISGTLEKRWSPQAVRQSESVKSWSSVAEEVYNVFVRAVGKR